MKRFLAAPASGNKCAKTEDVTIAATPPVSLLTQMQQSRQNHVAQQRISAIRRERAELILHTGRTQAAAAEALAVDANNSEG